MISGKCLWPLLLQHALTRVNLVLGSGDDRYMIRGNVRVALVCGPETRPFSFAVPLSEPPV